VIDVFMLRQRDCGFGFSVPVDERDNTGGVSQGHFLGQSGRTWAVCVVSIRPYIQANGQRTSGLAFPVSQAVAISDLGRTSD
jgi:hypothetical protein